MQGPYMTAEEMAEFHRWLEHALEDTRGCWKATRLHGRSASLACDGNISIPLLKAFDEIAAAVREKEDAA